MPSKQPATKKRSGGRKSRMASRKTNDPDNKVVRSGLTGGRYAPLLPAEVETIIGCALDVLAEVGVGSPPSDVAAQAIKQGASVGDNGRLHLPHKLVEQIISNAAKNFTLYGRDTRHDLQIGSNRVHLGTTGLIVKMVDPITGVHRPSTLTDLYDFGRMVDTQEHIHYYSRSITPSDITDLYAADMSILHGCLSSTSKHVFSGFVDAAHVKDGVELLDMVAGGKGDFAKAPFMSAIVCSVVSPLRFGPENVAIAIEAARSGIPMVMVMAGQAGATAPASLSNTLIMSLAEALAGLVLINLFMPGHPVLVGSWPFVSDLRTGAFSGGGGEQALLASAAVQITNALGLPSSQVAGMTDSKIPDFQAGAEKAITVELAALAGGNMINSSAGIYSSLMTASFEGVVLDNDMFGNILRTVRGIEVVDPEHSVDIIQRAVSGEGHFLGDPDTLALMETEYLYPKLFDRTTSDDWEAQGRQDIRERAQQVACSILESHYPSHLNDALDADLRKRFPIQLPSMSDLKKRSFKG
ncbi:MAG: trimethylamine methyltransferase [Gammaproteobacteria bacterium]|nr:trimethylamine methyltransferase [Gammaproteobacteria bacterium]